MHHGHRTAVIGIQFGDEGKSKVIDWLLNPARSGVEYDIVARFQGGQNAGHTQWFGDKQVILHIVPSGITHEGIYNVILAGCFLDPVGGLDEVRELEKKGYVLTTDNFGISGRAHVTFGYHKEEEVREEAARSGGEKIGSTMKGIGTTAVDKTGRLGIRFAEFCSDGFEDLLRQTLELKKQLTGRTYDAQKYIDECAEAREYFAPFLIDEAELLASRRDSNWLIESAQAIGLDMDYGTYPFNTSSTPRHPAYETDENIGVVKAFQTRVGAGPRPTVIGGEIEKRIRGELGVDRTADFGATTGRPRSCCWFDGVLARYGVIVGEIDRLAVVKMDKLDGIDPVRICTHYRHKNDMLRMPPQDRNVYEGCEPVYEDLPGWPDNSSAAAREPKDLHPNAQDYLKRLEEITNCPIALVSVGPEAEQTIKWK